VNFGYYVTDPNHKGCRDGGRLCRLDLRAPRAGERSGKLTVLLDDPRGGVRDPQVHYDGSEILFSYRRGGQPYYHLYTVRTDGTGLRQLTDGPFDDIEPAYLPDGGLIFASSRCNRWVACWYTPVAILYRCDADGRNVRMLSSSIVHDNTPWVLPDGRVLYTRWEYVDRSRVQFHHLWTVNPDGTGQMAYYGNQHGGTVMIDAKPIPGTSRVVASFSPGHGVPEHQGAITVINPNAGPDTMPFARRISHGDGDRDPRGERFHDPYPLSDDCFLVACGKQLLVMDGKGDTQVLYELPPGDRLDCHEPMPLRPRPRERVIPPRVNLRETTGRLTLVDVTYGRNMAGVRRGEVKKLLILEQLPKQANFSGGMEPLTLGGAFTLKRILGTVPVEPDGSASFEVPALRSLFFVTVQPGESTNCAGCHENRTDTPPPSGALLALQRPPSRIQPIDGVPEIFDFPRDIQPILDRHCVRCHDYDAHDGQGPQAGGIVLCGDHGPMYSHAYATLLSRGLVSHGRDADGNKPPRAIGTSASRLMKLIDGSHYAARLSAHEQTMVRLWIESGVFYPGTYAALGTGMVGVALPKAELYARCGACHEGDRKQRSLRFKTHEELLCNLSRPEKSLLLLAPLAPEAGGCGLCKPKPAAAAQPPKTLDAELASILNENKEKPAEPGAVFASTEDPEYKKTLDAIRQAQRKLSEIKRFDMPGFRPNLHYLREMKHYGILPRDLPADAPIDVYATDREYWKSLWYKPASPWAGAQPQRR